VWICAHCADAPEAAVAYQVTNGKNAMPAFGGKLCTADIADVAAYVIDQPRPGGVFCLASALALAAALGQHHQIKGLWHLPDVVFRRQYPMHMAMHRQPAISLWILATGIKLMGGGHQGGNELRTNQFWGAGHRGGDGEWFVGVASYFPVCECAWGIAG